MNLISNGVWSIQNFPVMSIEGDGVNQTQRFWFPLGVASGTEVNQIACGITLSGKVADAPPTSNEVEPVDDEPYILDGGIVDVPQITPPPPATVFEIHGPVLDWDAIKYAFSFPNQECGEGECVPAAVSNSLYYLNAEYNLGMNPADITIDEMKDATGFTLWWLSGYGPIHGCPDDWWEDKDAYMIFNDLPITTEQVLPKDIGTIGADIKNGQDVEMMVTGHVACVMGVADLGDGNYAITVAHDTQQGQPGGCVIDAVVWNSTSNQFSGALAGRGLEYFVVECPLAPAPEDTGENIGVNSAPILGPMNEMQYRFFPSLDDITTALEEPDSKGGVDITGYSFTGTQLAPLLDNTGIIASAQPEGYYYCAYKTGTLSPPLDTHKTDTINYTGPPANTPESNIIFYGILGLPDMLNPIFSRTAFDFQVLDEIFTCPIVTNPWHPTALGSAITGNPTGNDLPWMAYSWKTELVNDPYNPSNPQWTNVTLWFRNDITWQDGVPFTVADISYTIYINALYGDSWDWRAMAACSNVSSAGTPDAQYQATPSDPNYAAPYFTEWNPYCCSILVSSDSPQSLYYPLYNVVPYHLYKDIVPSNITAAEEGLSTDGLHGLWPGQAAVAGNLLPGAPFTLEQLTRDPGTTLVGTGPWKYRAGSAISFAAGGGITLDAYRGGFFMTIASARTGAIAFKYTWLNTSPGQQPSGGYYKVGIADLTLLANAYGTTGKPPSSVSVWSIPGAAHTWNPAADLAAPSGSIGLSDLVTLSLHYGWYYGNYSYNAPYPPSEIANGGP